MRLVIVESPFAPQTGKVNACALHGAIADGDGCTPCHLYRRAETFRGLEIARNIDYGCAALADCFRRGEAPYASHLLYTRRGVLDDTKPDERQLGIRAGFMWRKRSDATAVYTDLGISQGMQLGIDDAAKDKRVVEYRSIVGWKK